MGSAGVHNLNRVGCALLVCFFGVVLAVAGVSAKLWLVPRMAREKVMKGTSLVPDYGSDRYKAFVSASAGPPNYARFWLYDLKNAAEFVNGSQPVVEERGPYTYRLDLNRFNLTWNDDKTLISFLYSKHYTFLPDQSVGPETDTFTLPNVIYVAANQYLYHSGAAGCTPNTTTCPDTLISDMGAAAGSPLMETLTVKQILWGRTEGLIKVAAPYANPFFQFLMNCSTPAECHRYWWQDHYFGMGGSCKVEDMGTDNTPGCVSPNHNPNATLSFTMHTGYGVDNMDKTAEYHTWFSNTSVGTELEAGNLVPVPATAAPVQGTTGISFPPFLDKSKPLRVFDDEAMSSLELVYDRDTSFNDIPVWRYREGPTAFPLGGLRNITNTATVKFGQPCPALASLPHFLGATNPMARTARCTNCFNGPENVTVYVDVEPFTGLSVKGRKRVQMNLHVGQPYLFGKPDYACARNGLCPNAAMPESLVPLLWFELASEMDARLVSELKGDVRELQVSAIAPWVVVALGALVALLGLALLVRAIVARRRDAPLGARVDGWPAPAGDELHFDELPLDG